MTDCLQINEQHALTITLSKVEKKVEMDFDLFVNKNFEPPEHCKNLGQIKYYLDELYLAIESFNKSGEQVPLKVFILISQYTEVAKQLAQEQAQH